MNFTVLPFNQNFRAIHMKKFILSILIFVISEIGFAQLRNLNFYFEQAKTNSPLIIKNQAETKILELDLNQVKKYPFKTRN